MGARSTDTPLRVHDRSHARGRWLGLLVVVAILAGTASARPAAGSTTRSLSAALICDGSGLRVTVTNRSGAAVHVAFARAAVHPADRWRRELDLADRSTDTLTLPIAAGGVDPAEAALVVTSAGVLAPTCAQPSASAALGPLPPSQGERDAEAARIALVVISQLEAIRAFDALYALLHTDAQALVSPEQVACWYVGELANTTTAAATALGVAFAPWTWGGNGRTYDAAAVRYRQPYWVGGVRQEREGAEHLVLDHGQWRWFLGTDPAWLANLPATCDASGAGIQPRGTQTPGVPPARGDQHAGTDPQALVDALRSTPFRNDELPSGLSGAQLGQSPGPDGNAVGQAEFDIGGLINSKLGILYVVYADDAGARADYEGTISNFQQSFHASPTDVSTDFRYPAALLSSQGYGGWVAGCYVLAGNVVVKAVSVSTDPLREPADGAASLLAKAALAHLDLVIQQTR